MLLHRSLIDTSYSDALQCLLHDLGCTENEITAEDYEAVEDCCNEMGWTGELRSRIMDLVPCEESEEKIDETLRLWKESCLKDDENCDETEEEIQAWKENTHGASQRSDGTWTDEE